MSLQDETGFRLSRIARGYQLLMQSVRKLCAGNLSLLLVRPPVNIQAKYLNISIITAVPHAATEDDVYNGFMIPKGVFIPPVVIAII